MISVYYSPHATSVDNEAGRASGHADIALSVKGLQKAEELGRHYAVMGLDAVYCSDLQRAYVTSQIAFSALNIPIIPDARLREFDYGEMTQCPRDELGLEDHMTEPFPKGESIQMAIERVGDFLRETLPLVDGKTIAVIGHVATKYGIEYWSSDKSLEDVVRMQWEWLDVPIWRYAFDNPMKRQDDLRRR
jgi:broad specificity phosphatase PhoE